MTSTLVADNVGSQECRIGRWWRLAAQSPESPWQVSEQILRVDAHLGEDAGVGFGIHLVREVGLGLGGLGILAAGLQQLDDLTLVDLHALAPFFTCGLFSG